MPLVVSNRWSWVFNNVPYGGHVFLVRMASNNFWKTWHEYIFCLEGSTKTKNRVEFPKQVSGGIHQTKYFRVESSRQHFVWLTTTYFPCLEGCVWKKTIFEDILVKSNHHEMCPCLERCVWKSTLNPQFPNQWLGNVMYVMYFTVMQKLLMVLSKAFKW